MAKTKFYQGKTNYETWRDASDDNKQTVRKMAIINEMLAKVKAGEKLTLADEIKLVSCINVSTLTGKLDGFHSVSTSVLMNPICQARARDPESICSKCYAADGLNNYNGLMQACEINFIILNTFLISIEAWKTLVFPTTNNAGRIESHGDVATVTCARNYLRIIVAHKWITYGVFSKNLTIYHNAIQLEGGKPGNMIFIASSDYMNKIIQVPEKYMYFVDHTFTVYTLEYAMKNHVVISCGGRSCKGCMRCYKHNTDTFNIAELEKKDAKKAHKIGFDIGA